MCCRYPGLREGIVDNGSKNFNISIIVYYMSNTTYAKNTGKTPQTNRIMKSVYELHGNIECTNPYTGCNCPLALNGQLEI